MKPIKAGTVNMNQIPSYRFELSPFGGIKDRGLGIKVGVIEAIETGSRLPVWFAHLAAVGHSRWKPIASAREMAR